MARRSLITEAMVLEALKAGPTTLIIPANALITPLARDTAREKGLTFVEATLPDTPPPQVKATCGCQHASGAPAAPRTVALGSDHGGYAYKPDLAAFLHQLGWRVVDVGTHSAASCDYPDYAYAVARAVILGQAEVGIMIDGAGIGSAMVCNKVPGIRAACAYNGFTAWNARAHNDANVLTLGSRTLGIEVCKRIVQTFLNTAFEGGRHQQRVDKIGDVEARRHQA